MNPVEAYQNLDTDPKFASLSYSDQVQVRQQLVQQITANDQNFAQLPDSDRDAVLKNLVYAPPVTLNPQYGKLLKDNIAAADAGDEDAKHLYSKLYNSLDEGLNCGLIPAIAHKASTAIGEGMAVAGIRESSQQLMLDAAGSEDAAKLFQYMNTRKELGLSDYSDYQAPEEAVAAHAMLGELGSAEGVRNINRFVSGSLDFVATSQVFSGINAGIRGLPLVKAIIEGGSKPAQVGAGVVLPLLGESVAAGAAGVADQKLTSVITNNISADPTQDFNTMALSFGFGAAMNFALGAIFRAPLVHAIAAGKAVFDPRDLAALGPDQTMPTPEQLNAAIDELGTSRTAAPVLKERLSNYQRAVMNYRDALHDIAKIEPTKLSPEQQLMLQASNSSHDIVIAPKGDGTIDMFYMKPREGAHNLTDLEHYNAPTIMDAYDTVAAHIQKLARIDPETGVPKNGTVSYYGRQLLQWQKIATLGTQAAEAAQELKIPDRVTLSDRPYISADEVGKLSQSGIVRPIRVEAGYDSEMLSNIVAHKQALTYADMHVFPAGTENINSVLLATNVLDVSAEMIPKFGVNDILHARLDGYDTVRFTDDSGAAVGYAPLVPNNLKVLVTHVDDAGAVLDTITRAPIQKPMTAGAFSGSMRSTISTEISAAEAATNDKLLAQQAMSMTATKLEPSDVKTYAKMLTGNSAIETEVSFSSSKEPAVRYDNGKLKITVPEQQLVGQERVKFAQSLTSQLRDSGAMRALPTGPQRVMSKLIKLETKSADVIDKMFVADSSHGIWGSRTLGNMLKRELGGTLIENADGTYTAKFGGISASGTLQDIWKSIKPQLASPKGVTDALLQEGIKLRTTADGVVATTLDKQVFSFPSYKAAAEHFGVDTAILPAEYRPKFVEINPESNRIQVYAEDQGVHLGKAEAFQLLSQFASDTPIEKLTFRKAGNGFATYITKDSTVQFIDPASKTALRFKNLDEAKQWYSESFNTFTGKRDIAMSKGMNIEYSNNGYNVYLGDASRTVYRVKSLDELDRIFATVPTISFDANELVSGANLVLDALPEELLAEWSSFKSNLQPLQNDLLNDYRAWRPEHSSKVSQHVSNLMSTFNSSLEKLRIDNKIHPALVKSLRAVQDASMARRVDQLQVDRLLDSIWRVNKNGDILLPGEKGVKFSSEDDSVIYRWMGAQDSTELKLSEAKLVLAKRLRSILNNAATKFGLHPDMMNGNYMSRIRIAVLSDSHLRAEIDNATSASDCLAALERSPHNLKEAVVESRKWFEYSRKSELLDNVFDTSAYSSTRRYLHEGIRKYWMDIPSQELRNTYNQVKFVTLPNGETIDTGRIPPDADALLQNFMQVTSGHQHLSDVIVADVGKTMMKGFGERMAKIAEKFPDPKIADYAKGFRDPKFAERGNAVLDDIMAIGYASLLGGRAMAAIRNVTQLYTMYGPSFGFEHIDAAVNHWIGLSQAGKDAYLRGLEKLGVVSTSHPYVDTLGSVGVIKKTSAVLLKWFGNSDEYTRMLGYGASTSRFATACQRLQAGVYGDITTARGRFMEAIGGDLFQKTEPEMLDSIWKAVTENARDLDKCNAAKMQIPDSLKIANDQFARAANDLTLFNYTSWNKPMLFNRGVAGKMLGQLGMFTASYRNMFEHVARNVPKSQLVAYLGSFVAVNTAAYAAFQAIGIRANDFIPFASGAPAIGPIADAFITAVRGTSSFSTKQERVDFTRLISPVVQGKKPQIPGIDSKYLPTPWVANYPAILPGSILAHYGAKALDYAARGDWYRALVSLSGAAVDPDLQSDLKIGLPGAQATIPGAHPQALARSLANLLSRTAPEFRRGVSRAP